MAWVATDDFESYADGALAGNNGGSGWSGAWASSGSDNWTVQGTVVYEGLKAISSANSVTQTCQRSFTALSGTSNEVRIAIRRTTVSGAARNVVVFNAGATFRFQLEAGDNGGGAVNIRIATSGGNTIIETPMSADTWYLVVLDIDMTNSQVRGKLGGGTYTSYRAMDGSGAIDTVKLQTQDGTGTGYFDYLGPQAAAAGGIGRLMMMGVGR